MKSDADLLSSYVNNRSEAAFTEIVRRHIPFVYSYALRRVGGDSHFAEDVTQKVFSDLARKASAFTNRPTISSWLYVSARLASAEIVRKERRRKAREKEASAIHGVLTPASDNPHADWTRMGQLLDDLIFRLNVSDREAVILRFYLKRTYSEIGWAQNITEEAARKRVERAVEKLRRGLATLGLTSATDTFEAALAREPDKGAPAPLADRVAGIAFGEFAAVGASTSFFLSAVSFLTSNLATTAVAILAAALLIAWQHHKNLEIEAEGERLIGQIQAVHGLEFANRQLSQNLAEADGLRRTLAAIPTSRPRLINNQATNNPISQIGIPSNISVTAQGTIRWENTPITLDEFIKRSVALQTQNPTSKALVHGDPNTPFSAISWVVEQASKAGFTDTVVDGPATPSAANNWIASTPATVPAQDKLLPMQLDTAGKP